MKTRRLFVLVLFGTLVSVLALAACSPQSPQAQEPNKLQQILERGEVVVAVTSEFPPMGFVDENGELVGFDIDIARLLAKSLFDDENAVQLERTSFDARWAAVQTGQVDVGIMGTTILPDRIARVAFSDIYADSGFAVLVRADAGVTHISELNSPEFTIARRTDPSEERAKNETWPEADEVVLSAMSDMFTAVETGRADAAILGLPVARFSAADNESFEVLDQLIGNPTRYGLFTSQDDFAWWLYLDTFTKELRSGSLYGEYNEIHNKWFGVDAPPQNWYLEE